MARIPTVDVIVNSESAIETAQSGRGMVSVMPTGRNGNKIYRPTPLNDRVQVLSSGDFTAIETKYTTRFEPPV